MSLAARVVLVTLTVAAASACARAGAGVATELKDPHGISRLELIGEFNIPALTSFDKLTAARFGGISGLTLDARTGELLGICDDAELPRVFVFKLPPYEPGAFRVDLYAYLPLPRHASAPAQLDSEAIAMTRGGRLFVASEGIQRQEPRLPPAIVEYSRSYAFVRQLAVPSKFIPTATGEVTSGVRNNAAFESLTFTPDERKLFTAAESPLVQDGPAATTTSGALTRILEYEASGDTFEPRREFAYPLDPLGRLPFTPGFNVTGLVELLALSDTELLTMERGFAQEANNGPRSTNRIKVFRASLDGVTDVSGLETLRGNKVVAARKQLLLDLGTVKGLSPELAELDNFEGMTFGPRLADGSRTLLLVSDDNFNPRQRTSFLLFRIVP